MQASSHCLELDSRERFAKAEDQDLILILSILLFSMIGFSMASSHVFSIVNTSHKQKNDY